MIKIAHGVKWRVGKKQPQLKAEADKSPSHRNIQTRPVEFRGYHGVPISYIPPPHDCCISRDFARMKRRTDMHVCADSNELATETQNGLSDPEKIREIAQRGQTTPELLEDLENDIINGRYLIHRYTVSSSS
jgi:hypothetical protein